MPRQKNSIDYVFNNQKYLNILALIKEYSDPNNDKKITIKHLKFVLLKGFKPSGFEEEKMISFFSDPYGFQQEKQKLKDEYENKIVDKDVYLEVSKMLKFNSIEKLKLLGIFSDLEKHKITGEANLRKYLRNLKNLDLIKLIARKKADPYYLLTSKGLNKMVRLTLHNSIDTLIPDGRGALFLIQFWVFRYGLMFKEEELKNKK